MTVSRLNCVAADRTMDDLMKLQRCLVEHSRVVRRLGDHYSLLASETRLKILALLECSGELCVCDLATVLGMTPAAVSQHLSRLRSGSLVTSRRDGMTIFYRRTEVSLAPEQCIPELREL